MLNGTSTQERQYASLRGAETDSRRLRDEKFTIHNSPYVTRFKCNTVQNWTTSYLIVRITCINITLVPLPIPSRIAQFCIISLSLDAALRHAQDARLAQLVNAPTQAHAYKGSTPLPGGQSPAQSDLKCSVWHCRNTVAYDVSGDNG